MSNPSSEWAAQLKITSKNSDGTTETHIIRRTSSDFKLVRELGEGSYSTVMLAKDIHTEKLYAIKVLDKRHIVKEKKVKYVTIEKDSLNRLGRHQGIVHLFFTFQDEFSLYFVLDFASNGELLSLIKKYGSLNENVTRYYSCQIIDALKYIHSCGIIHRDLKPENILLDDDFQIQVTDFGTAKFLEKDDSGKYIDDGRAKSFVGTAEYVSPELLNEKSVGKPCDVWALGCIIFQMIAGRPPFKATNDYLTFQQVMKVKYAFSAGFPTIVRDLVKRILVANPDHRPTLKDLEKHLFFQGINWKDPNDIWYSPPPEFGPYKMSAQSMKPISGLDTTPVNVSIPAFTPRKPKQKEEKDKPSKLSTNAALIALSNLSVGSDDKIVRHSRQTSAPAESRKKSDRIIERRSSENTHKKSADKSRKVSEPAAKRGSDLRMRYHDEQDSKPRTIRSISLPPTPNMSSLSSSSHSPSNHSSSHFGPSSPLSPLGSPRERSKTERIKPPKIMKNEKPKLAIVKDNEETVSWKSFLQPGEQVIKVGVLYVKILTTNSFEKKFKGKLTSTPLYYKGKRMVSGTGNSSSNYSLLSQMVHGNNRMALRDHSNSTLSSTSSGSSGSKSELELSGIVHHVRTSEVEQVEAELDPDSASSTSSHGTNSGMFKKILSTTKSALNTSLLPQNNSLEFHNGRVVIVTSHGRLLILGKRPGYIKTAEPENVSAKYQIMTEVDLAHSSIRFKEVLMESGPQSPRSPRSPGFESEGLIHYYGVFAVMTYSTTLMFQVDKMHLNGWTEALVESRLKGMGSGTA